MSMRPSYKKKDPQGFGLIEFVIGVGLLAIVAFASKKVMTTQYKSYEIMQFRGNVESARALVRASIDCRQSLILSPCPAGAHNQTIVVKTNGQTLIGASGLTTVVRSSQANRSVKVKAYCSGVERELRMSYLTLKGTSWRPFLDVPIKCPKDPT